MGLEDFKTDEEVIQETWANRNARAYNPEYTSGQTVDSEELAIQAVKDAAEQLGHSPTAREYDRIRGDIGYSTPAGRFRGNCGIQFNSAKEKANLETYSWHR